MLANPAGVNYESHAEKILGDKKHAEGFSLRILTLRSSIQHINSVAAAAKVEVPLFWKYESLLAQRAVAGKYQKTSRLSRPPE